MALDKDIYMSDDDYEAKLDSKSKKYWSDVDDRDQFVSDMNELHDQTK